LFEESPSIIKAIKKHSHTTKELELLKMQMTKEIMTQILKSEQVGRKLLLKGQLQIIVFFNEVLKPQNPTRPSSSTCGNI
jgi:hypothetical protein